MGGHPRSQAPARNASAAAPICRHPGVRSAGAVARPGEGGHSSRGRSAIGAEADAPGQRSLYRGAMRSRAVVGRYAIEALALALAVAGQIELWAGPGARPDAIVVIAALVATVPLLVRRRFPFGAPAFVFTGLALIALASPATLPRGTSFTLF